MPHEWASSLSGVPRPWCSRCSRRLRLDPVADVSVTAAAALTSSHNLSGVWGCRALCGKSPTATRSAIVGPLPAVDARSVLAAALLTLLRQAHAQAEARRRLDAGDVGGAVAWRAVARHWSYQRARLGELAEALA